MQKKSPFGPLSQPLSVAVALLLFVLAYFVTRSLAESIVESWVMTTDVWTVRLVLAVIALPIWLFLCRLLANVTNASKR